MLRISSLEFSPQVLATAMTSIDIANLDQPTADEFSLAFGRQVGVSAELDEAFQFLAIVCSWRLHPDDEQIPFDFFPSSPTIDDVSEAQLATVAVTHMDECDPELRARLSDLIWVRQRKHEYARIAAECYITSAERLILNQKILGERERLTRAVQLAAFLGRSGNLFSNVVDRIVKLADAPLLLDCSLATCLRVLLISHGGDPARLQQIAVDRAQFIVATRPNPLWERGFWELGAAFARRNRNKDANRMCSVEAARTFECEAQRATLQSVAAHYWQQALRSYKAIPNTEVDRIRVHTNLIAAQENIRHEFIPSRKEPDDNADLIAYAQERVRNKDKRRALAEIVFATGCRPKEYFSQQAEQSINGSLLYRMFASSRFSSTWKVSANIPGTSIDHSEIDKDQLRAEMCQQFQYWVQVDSSGVIEPMRHALHQLHCITMDDVAEYVLNSQIVPLGREALYVVGLHAGIHGRFIEALHVLIPQLEYLLRCELGDVITSTFDLQNGTQEEFDLNRILCMKEAESRFGEDFCFSMRALFTDKNGYNLRNELAHGMMNSASFFSDAAIYAWWFIFHTVASPFAKLVVIQSDAAIKAASVTPNPS